MRAPRPAVLIACSLLFSTALFSQDSSRPPLVRVRLYDYANLRRDMLEEAQRQTQRVLSQAGVAMDWMPCRVPAIREPDTRCAQPVNRSDIIVNVLPRAMAAQFHQPKNALAFSGVTAGGADDQRVWIFNDSIRDLGEKDASYAQILGHVEAHELGHLLMHEPGHTRTGLMRAHWSADDLHTAAQGGLLFNSQQAATIRGEVERRWQESSPRIRADIHGSN